MITLYQFISCVKHHIVSLTVMTLANYFGFIELSIVLVFLSCKSFDKVYLVLTDNDNQYYLDIFSL